jgi:cytochrome c oxidase assembly protein subunit 15
MRTVKQILSWIPDRVDTRLRVVAWVYLAAQILLVGTGGLVRLTGSGLGCPTWPTCTADSLVNTPEMGIHGMIEFGNRLLAVVLAIVAVVAFVAVLRLRRIRRDLFWLTLLAGLGIPAQAVIGGVSVWTGLNPYVVGLHFVVSVVLVVLCAVFVSRVSSVPGPRALAVPRWYALLAWATAFFAAVTILVGIITTGSGPHAGDAHAPRNGLDSELLQHVHSWPAYATFVLTVLLVAIALRRRIPVAGWATLLLVIELMQIGVGLLQANTGLPPFLVGLHMVLAAALAAAVTAVLLNLSAPVPVDRPQSVRAQATLR